MTLIEVNDKKTQREFHDTARIINKNDKNWICLLDAEVEGIFTPGKNVSFQNGEAIRWILKDNDGKLIGRIGAFYDLLKAKKHDQPTGGIGFFECVNDSEAAKTLFDKAVEWLKTKGMEAMDGPINFGENINHWGLLIEGYMPQGYGMPYNQPYYKDLFTKYGFKTFFEQYTYHKDLTQPFPERQEKFARHVGTKESFSFEHFSFANHKKYVQNIVDIFNTVWKDFHEDYTPLKFEDIELMLMEAKPIIVEEYIWFGYDNGLPVAMVVVFPDVNQVFSKLNGKLSFFGKLKFLYYKKKINRVRQLITGVIPSHQKTYIIGALFLKMVDALRKNNIKELEMSWVGDYNVTVNKIYSMLELPVVKKHATLRYMFDQSKEVKRFTNENSDKMQKTLKNTE
ncbi:MAG: hypothetical protein A2W91_19070 [Bacteroidetes bacterium GWF2_38_335]|nr:MAG: hypothetical protein A2W91_19070 [Bacteroidetes bacterium GWF2_38_335]OFY80227.1 MAG: hypothetical protein A2281_17125 [Bacteroidetes bacterium RIFOXYA12_FULL_38_20]HBS88746.1 N-acetyltransferase [Bacteroidales bacterium]